MLLVASDGIMILSQSKPFEVVKPVIAKGFVALAINRLAKDSGEISWTCHIAVELNIFPINSHPPNLFNPPAL